MWFQGDMPITELQWPNFINPSGGGEYPAYIPWIPAPLRFYWKKRRASEDLLDGYHPPGLTKFDPRTNRLDVCPLPTEIWRRNASIQARRQVFYWGAGALSFLPRVKQAEIF